MINKLLRINFFLLLFLSVFCFVYCDFFYQIANTRYSFNPKETDLFLQITIKQHHLCQHFYVLLRLSSRLQSPNPNLKLSYFLSKLPKAHVMIGNPKNSHQTKLMHKTKITFINNLSND